MAARRRILFSVVSKYLKKKLYPLMLAHTVVQNLMELNFSESSNFLIEAGTIVYSISLVQVCRTNPKSKFSSRAHAHVEI
jgi:hypothetical protein